MLIETPLCLLVAQQYNVHQRNDPIKTSPSGYNSSMLRISEAHSSSLVKDHSLLCVSLFNHI